MSYIPYNTNLTEYARQNRKKPTKTESIFRNLLVKNKKFLGYKFRRQKVIGSFILDFYCPKLLLCIEIDGGYHNEQVEYDKIREEIIKEYGISILRFTNEDIENNLEGVEIKLEMVIDQIQIGLDEVNKMI